MFFFFLLPTFYHKCIHDEIVKDLPRDRIESGPNEYLLDLKSDPAPIRITFEYGFLNGDFEFPEKCVQPELSYDECIHYFSDEDIEIFNETLQNVVKFISRYVSSKYPRVTPIEVHSAKTFFDIENYTVSDSDLHIVILPYNNLNGAVAAASALEMRAGYPPSFGYLKINPYDIPDSVQNIDSSVSTYFNTLYHELNHILAFSSNLYYYWLKPGTQQIYGNDFPIENYSFNGKTGKILSTPKFQEWAKNRYGTETLYNGKKPGIELEDIGEGRTSGSHPKQSLILQDVMCGVEYGNERITEVSFVALEDSGFYEVDYTGTEYLYYGYGPSFNESLLTNFPQGVPRSTFPAHYQCYESETTKPTWDYHAKGSCDSIDLYCNEDCDFLEDKENCLRTKFQCDYLWFYDPYNTTKVSNYVNIPYIFPQFDQGHQCNVIMDERDDNAFNSNIEQQGDNVFLYAFLDPNNETPKFGYCIETECNENWTLTLTAKSSEQALCKEEGDQVDLGGYQIICSNPIHICGILAFQKKKHLNNDISYPSLNDLHYQNTENSLEETFFTIESSSSKQSSEPESSSSKQSSEPESSSSKQSLESSSNFISIYDSNETVNSDQNNSNDDHFSSPNDDESDFPLAAIIGIVIASIIIIIIIVIVIYFVCFRSDSKELNANP